MKKLLLALAAVAMGTTGTFAQTRLCLYEEFSGENCGPCAAANPGLWSLMQANTTKAVLLKYQSPIPSAGPIYNQFTTETDARLTYYSVPFAPYGRLNGTGLGTGTSASSAGHVANLTQADINNDYNAGSPFNMSVTHAFNAAGDSVTFTITATAVSAYAPASANMKLRVALTEHLNYASAPGSNGETEFHNVMRKMYPDATGTSVANTWAVGATQTWTIKGAVPSYVDKGNQIFAIVWLQDDNSKAIPQAAQSVPAPVPNNNLALEMSQKPNGFNCVGTTTSINHRAFFKNVGPNTATSATVYYRVDGGAWMTYAWTGTLLPNDTTSFAMPAISVAGMTAGSHLLEDSIGMVNGMVDAGNSNNNAGTYFYFQDNTPNSLPVSTGFDGTSIAPNWFAWDVNGNGANWLRLKISNISSTVTTPVGYNGSTHAMLHYNFAFDVGERNVLLTPVLDITNTTSSIGFYTSYRQYDATSGDGLEVVWSNDCGATWNSIWNQSGATLANLPISTSFHYPKSDADWRFNSVNLGSIPTGSVVGLRATSDYGNNLWVDSVTVLSTSAVKDIISNNHINLYPNPAKDVVTAEFVLNAASGVSVSVLDQTGRVVIRNAEEKLTPGVQKMQVNVGNLANGLYILRIQTEAGEINRSLSVVK